MSEEKKEQNDLLSDHEALLNSIKKPEAAEEEIRPEEPETEEAEVQAEEPAAVADEEPVSAEPEEDAEEEEIVDQKVEAEVPPVVTEVPAHPAPKKEKPATHAEAVKQRHAATEQAEVKEVLNFYMKYIKPAAAVLIVICLLVIGFSIAKSSRLKKEAAADTALMQARTAADYQAVIDNYGSTPSAPLALLGLAQQKFNAGAIAEAADLYGEFVKKYPRHDNAIQAEYNRINCIEAQGKYAEAAEAYGAFRIAQEKSHLAPQSLLDKGRCLEKLKQFDDARQVYEDVIAFYPDSGWAQLAQNNITILNTRK
ncbi:tetratricopeptide repeat protein [Pontiella sp.]|uniref:tetratricopeptide repeat protein n=1 Tax=Pontiella sp. TaxID=2837462 RepID=UPI0035647A56